MAEVSFLRHALSVLSRPLRDPAKDIKSVVAAYVGHQQSAPQNLWKTLIHPRSELQVW